MRFASTKRCKASIIGRLLARGSEGGRRRPLKSEIASLDRTVLRQRKIWLESAFLLQSGFSLLLSLFLAFLRFDLQDHVHVVELAMV